MTRLRLPTLFAPAALALAICACAPPAPPPQPAAQSPEHALHSLRTGDLSGLLHALNKGDGHCARARAQMARLDPEAWLLFHGARWREHDLQAARGAQSDPAMRSALGFGDDALVSTLLRAPSRIGERHAGGRRYFQTVEPPLSIVDDLPLTGCPGRWIAFSIKYKAELSGRLCVARVGFAGAQMTELDAGEDIGETQAPKDNTPGFRSPRAALHGTAFAALGELLPAAAPARGRSLELLALDSDLNLHWLQLAAKGGQWHVVYALRSTQAQRLERVQDAALKVIWEAALGFERREGRWPQKDELGLRDAAWADPAAQLGWGLHSATAQDGLELSASRPPGDDDEVARDSAGRARILRSGRVVR